MTSNPIALENSNLRLEFDPRSGALTHIQAVQTGWNLLDRPGLGLSFRLLVPLRDSKDWCDPAPCNNPVNGEKHCRESYICLLV